MVVRFLTCRIGPFHVHNEFAEPLRRRPRISPSPCRSGVMRGQRREGRNPSVEPERRSSGLQWQPYPPTNSSEEPDFILFHAPGRQAHFGHGYGSETL